MKDSAEFYGASHLLVGDYAVRGEELIVSLRLVEADSKVVVAAAAGRMLIRALTDPVREAMHAPEQTAHSPALPDRVREAMHIPPSQGWAHARR